MHEVGTINIAIVQMRNLKCRESQSQAQGHGKFSTTGVQLRVQVQHACYSDRGLQGGNSEGHRAHYTAPPSRTNTLASAAQAAHSRVSAHTGTIWQRLCT